jgi:putative ABC transport system permease protein
VLPEENIPIFHKKLMAFLCREDLYHELAGDLEEAFIENFEQFGAAKARSIYKKEVRKMLRPSVLRKFEFLPRLTPPDMIKNYLKISLRNIWRDKEHSLISILGLAAGIVASVLIFQYTNFESSYDGFIDQEDGHVYKITREVSDIAEGEITSRSAHTFHAFHPAVSSDMPEVLSSTHVSPISGVFTFQETGHNIPDAMFTSGSFFDVFSFKLLEGIKEDLDQPGSVFLSKSMARRIFGDTPAMGKLIRYNDNNSNIELELQVKGIFEDFPSNSHIKANAFLPVTELNSFADNNWFGGRALSEVTWRWVGFHTYIKVLPSISSENLTDKLITFIRKYRTPYDQAQGRQQSVVPLKLEDVHFSQDWTGQLEAAGDKRMVSMFRYIGILIILIAWINFVNLASARAVKRAKEVGVRKALGALKKQLIQQFLIETALINLMAMTIAVGLALLIIPAFQTFVGAPVFDFFTDFMPFWIIYGAIFIAGSILSGLYPALVLTKFQPIKVLRGNFNHSTQGIWLRKGLMFVQFGIVLIILTGILGIRAQIQYMMDYDTGMKIDQTLVVNAPPPFLRDSTYTTVLDTYKKGLLSIPSVKATTITSLVPGLRNDYGQTTSRTDRPSNESIFLYLSSIDPNYMDFFGLELIEGRAFDESLKGDENIVLINEQALKEFGFETAKDAVGKHLTNPANEEPPMIVGVVKNFNQMGMKFSVDPLAMQLDTNGSGTFINIRVATENLPETIKLLEQRYLEFFPGAPFDSFFLDQTFNELYEADQKFKSVLQFFAIVAIFIAALGIFGLSSFLINSKIKEVSIRKVLGAGVGEIIRVLTKEYVWLISISTLVSIPVAYFLIKGWLNNFLVSVAINPLIFIIPVLGLIFILCLTIGTKTLKAVRVNPSQTLKSE